MAASVSAQTATSVIRGTVQDSTGAVVVEVKVLLIDLARNQSWRQATNEEGSFEFRALPLGHYRMELEKHGFKKAVVEEITLQVAETQNLKVTLEVGSLSELVVVPTGRGLLETSDAALSQVID